MSIFSRFVYLVLSIGLLVATSSCGEDVAKPCCPVEDEALVIVVGVHQGGPAPGLPAPIGPRVEAAVAGGQPVSLVAVDGTPHEVPLRVPTVNSDGAQVEFKTTLAAAVNTVISGLTKAKADSDHADLLGAIALAADTLPPGKDRGTIVVIDSGISDTGVLDLTVPGILAQGTDLDRIADYVAAHTRINLAGVRVLLTGIGDTVAPQTKPSATEKRTLLGLWTAVLERLGAQVDADPNPRDTTSPAETPYSTDTAPLTGETSYQLPRVGRTSTAVFDAGEVGFKDNSNELLDPAAAEAALTEIVAWLVGDRRRSVDLYGTTSSAGDAEGRRIRSQGRAETVERLLLDAGVDTSQTGVVRGLGMNFEDYLYDRLPDGSLDEVKAIANRTTQLVLHGAPQ